MLLPLVNMQAPPEKSSMQQQMMTKVSISILVMALPVLYVSVLHVPPSTLFRDTTFWFLMSNSIIVVIAADSGMLFFGSSSSSAYVDDWPFLAPVASTVVPVEELLPVVIMNEDHGLVVARDIVHVDTVVAMDSPAHTLVVRGDHGDVKPEGRETAPVEDGATVKARLTASRSLAREERAARRRRSRSHSHALVASVPEDPVVEDKSVVIVREEKLRRTATEGRRRATAAAAEEEEESEFYARLSDEELNRRVEDFISRFNREIRLQVEKEQA
ncbi:hypothetical protein ACQ4PT_059870 [Festuca glaucescens]